MSARKPDFSWYAGEVDHEVVRKIVALKRRAEILQSFKGKIKQKDLDLIDKLSHGIDAAALKSLYEQLDSAHAGGK